MTTQTEANARIKEIGKEIKKLVKEAEKLCDETGASFSLDIAWGMGGSYVPSLKNVANWTEEAREENYIYEEDGEWVRDSYREIDEDGGWFSSSMGC